MFFRSYADLRDDIYGNLWRIPRDVDLVVGVPRSGMLPATVVALARNLPLTDLGSFVRGETFATGSTRRRATDAGHSPRHALVIDDSARSGEAMSAALDEIRGALGAGIQLPAVTTAVVYGSVASRPLVDLTFREVDRPRIFEWNVLHHPGILAESMLDIDGVLCLDPTPLENDDGPRYERFLETARPLHIPSHPVGSLVTSRLERYRELTELWLSAVGVEYSELVMLDLPSAEERRRQGAHAKHKGHHYSRSRATLFIESELAQAEEIARLSGKPVLSLEGPRMCSPGGLSPRAISQSVRNPRIGADLLRRIIGDSDFERLKRFLLESRARRGGL